MESHRVVIVGGGFGGLRLAQHLKRAPVRVTLIDRRRVLSAFEAAERESDPEKRKALLTFVIVGAGPTGVELAGALGEIALQTLRGNYRHINPADARIFLIEGAERVLPPFPPDLSE